MRFDGQVWFDFSHRAVWDFYAFVRALAGDGTQVALEWRPFVDEGQVAAASTFLTLDDPVDRGRFLHTSLGLVHIEGADIGASETVRQAMSLAGIGGEPTTDADAVAAVRAEGEKLGVSRVPSLYRHGPVVAIEVNGAATGGDVSRRARTIRAMLDDDGLWSMVKP